MRRLAALPVALTFFAALSLAGCMTEPPPTTPAAEAPAPDRLAGTRWELVEFQSPEDSIGVKTPSGPDRYVLELLPGGQLALQLDCNRATGTWEAHATEPTHGTIALNVTAVTSAACLHETWEGRIPRDLGFVRSYTLAGDTLHLALKIDSGIYTWRRISP